MLLRGQIKEGVFDLGQLPCYPDEETEAQGGGKISSHNHIVAGGRSGIHFASSLLNLNFSAI